MRFEVNMETPTPDARGHLDEPQHWPLESLHYALRALRTEILGFRFDYPLEIDPNAGPKESLHYYLYSEKLSWDIMRMDPAGVPRVRSRLAGVVYKPAYIAWWGLVQLGHFLPRRWFGCLDQQFRYPARQNTS
jgi:hypothetical protein